MLSADDAELARRDPALPGLAMVLDTDRLAAGVRDVAATAAAGRWNRTYARYKPEHSCVVAYQVVTDRETLDIYARAHRPRSYARRRRRLELDSGGRMLVERPAALDDACVIVRPARADPGLEALSELAPGGNSEPLLDRILGSGRERERPAVTTLRYWPERRYTCRLSWHEGEAALKLYWDRAFELASEAVRAFQDANGVRVPRVLGNSGRDRALAFEWLPGVRLDHALAEPGFDPASMEEVAAALARLHAHPGPGLHPSEPATRASFARDRTGWIAKVLRPSLAETASRVADRAAAGLAERAAETATIHGDFSPAQVLVDAQGPAIVDLDRAARGDPMADLGSFAAQLERGTIDGTVSPERTADLIEAFLGGYRSATGRLDRPRIACWTAMELVANAPGAFRRPVEGWRERVAALVARAGEVLRESAAI